VPLVAVVVLVLVGAVGGRVVATVRPAPVMVSAAPQISDLQFAGAAQATVLDFLSWNATDSRAPRTAALQSPGLTGIASDGWDGSGQLSVENAITVVVLRMSDDQAVVTVQAKAAGPGTDTLSPPNGLGSAVQAVADEDAEIGRTTADTVSKLITAYGSGDLEFVRGPGSSFTGLAGMVAAGQVLSWRVACAVTVRCTAMTTGNAAAGTGRNR
jgi:hypothetical protein